MIVATSGASTAVVVLAVVIVLIVVLIMIRSVRVIQQGTYGVVKRLGQFHAVKPPGVVFLIPFIDRMMRIDVREIPRTGDHQDVITKDNVSVGVSATIFSQVIDPRSALFAVSDYEIAIDQLGRTALRAVFGGLTLDEALSERERINSQLQQHMDPVTEKWGIRINRIEIVDMLPPAAVLQAMSLQKEAEQHKRAQILQSEGQKQSAINTAEGGKQAAILAAEGQREALIRESEGRAQAIATVYAAILDRNPTPELLAVLQLDTLGKLVASSNAKLVVPVETAGLIGASQALRSLLDQAADTGGS